MNHFLNQIAKDLTNTNLERYWPNFELVAYALYDQNSVFLFNHPRYNDIPPKHSNNIYENSFFKKVALIYVVRQLNQIVIRISYVNRNNRPYSTCTFDRPFFNVYIMFL